MGKKLRKTAVFAPLVFVIISCVTINIYFPAAAVEKAADQIVEEVWGGQEQENNKEKEKNGKQQGLLKSWTRLASLTIGPSVAHAQEADINVTTPGIRAIKDSISQRADSIKPFLDRGNVGIANDGLLVIRTTDGLDLKEKATLTRLIKSENDDREALYAEIAKANNFSPDRIPDIKKLFAGSWIKMARKGWWVQSDDGRWSQKE